MALKKASLREFTSTVGWQLLRSCCAVVKFGRTYRYTKGKAVASDLVNNLKGSGMIHVFTLLQWHKSKNWFRKAGAR